LLSLSFTQKPFELSKYPEELPIDKLNMPYFHNQ
jgi:hypothetical protein